MGTAGGALLGALWDATVRVMHPSRPLEITVIVQGINETAKPKPKPLLFGSIRNIFGIPRFALIRKYSEISGTGPATNPSQPMRGCFLRF